MGYKHTQMNEKIKTLQGLLSEDPNDPDLPFLLGKALLDVGAYSDAIKYLERGAQMNSQLAAIWKFWGKACEANGDVERAIELWREGIALSEATGDLQAGKEMRVFLKRAEAGR